VRAAAKASAVALLVAIALLPAVADAQQQPTQPGWPQPVDNERTFGTGILNQNEWRAGNGSGTYRWDGEAWYGGDLNRAWLKTEGDLDAANGTFGEAEVQGLYSRAIGPYFDLQEGVRWNLQPGPSRGWAAVGVEGLAPLYWNVGVFGFLSDGGRAAARLEAFYNLPLTQRLFLQPQFEVNAYTKTDASSGVGSGLSDLDSGLRLRYEIRRQLAPYVGITYESTFGAAAAMARRAGTPVSRLRLTAGVRLWH
jgi:copper resistance protein B